MSDDEVVSSCDEAERLAGVRRHNGKGELPARVCPDGLNLEPTSVNNMEELRETVSYAIGKSPYGRAKIFWPE
ncbi:hypothetical protein A2671_01450 [Candidatus Kaiserbacteria bacterium RIFCSPHIGHO2_01_FULL_49_13]|uniref:Uncharacterized protein n=1 Tax=Candidatus Kaiserbacteria bacterium RIFCSPHIGHO2_01_FULL_49_13 TaxID=1798477 RepID=A0A1F6CDS4_9BACT|nr:MAG: hypothetical protein A2671_01450 [Candidatus Kaiserbacteria bacterium RIFCSPHIGHO2_01_FULL_49_13]